ncbi:MAG: hypothetical protein HOE90_22480 [Bacteriovoracaceae bacterium]|jgi:hypothetical protein|nr:hypothetical protein [Bacteriovoracaceae bacterium]
MKFVCIVVLFASFSVFSSELILKQNGKIINKIDIVSIKSGQFSSNGKFIGSLDKTLFNAWRGYERTYRGYSFYELLDVIYGENWRKAKTISFYALDGYKQVANISKMIRSSHGKPGYLSYTETGKKGFSKFKRKNKIVDPGPLYLVWSNFSESDKASHGDTLKWPYQLKTIEIKTE